MNPAETLKDPVCGMTVTPQSSNRAEFEGRPVYFCCAGCKAKFGADPRKYMQPGARRRHRGTAAAAAPAGTVYTCPMHPEVRQDRPGACPKCGMALEPEMPSLEEGESPELIDFRRRFWWTLPATIAITVLAMFGHRLGLMDMATQSWVELVLSLPVVLWAGWPFFVRARAVGRQPQPQHVDADRPRNRRGLRLQRRRHHRAGRVSGLLRLDGPGVGLLRGRRGHHLADAARPSCSS